MTKTSTAWRDESFPAQAAECLPVRLAECWPPRLWEDVTVLIAVSGGADSVALVRALEELRPPDAPGRLILAHFNHRLRGAESDADQAFVEQLARYLEFDFILGSPDRDLGGAHQGKGLEGAAREARYEFLIGAAAGAGARYIATAHTADDQVETVLHNVLRGTGLAGLAGIPGTRRVSEMTTLVRPLLGFSRNNVVAYLQSLEQPYRDDSTNQLEDFTRNRIRLMLLPLLEQEFNPRVREALLRLGAISAEADKLIREMVETKAEQVIRTIAGGIEIDLEPLGRESDSVVQYLLLDAWRNLNWPQQDMSYEKWREVAALTRANQDSTIVLPGGVRAERRADMLRLTRP